MRLLSGPGKLALCLGALLVAGCDMDEANRPHNPNYREPMVNGYVYKTEYYDGEIEYDKDVEVYDNDGLPMVPVVTLNAQPLEIYYYGTTVYRYGDNQYNPVDVKYELKVTHYWGDAFSRIVLPGDFRITGPQEGYILGLESTLVATWRSSPSTQWYWVGLYADYDFIDTLFQWDDYTFYLDTLVHDTFLVVSPERVFPGYIRNLIEGDGSVMVWAGNGPAIEPGDIGNVRGAGFGWFNAINEPREAYFYVGAPPLTRRVPAAADVREERRARLRQRAGVR